VSLSREISRVRLVGSSDAIRRVEQKALMAARVDKNVLITGEHGVGKAVVARFIHENSERSANGFAVLHCDGLPDLLFESELFGHVRGSFGGAYRDKPGLLESVRGGTLFLDEVGTLSPRMQGRLLRHLATGENLGIGSDHVQVHARLNVRLIASTSASLPALVDAGLFLKDLHGRLNAVCLSVPPLRERRDDIPSLVDHFIGQFAGRSGASVPDTTDASPRISSEVYKALCRADWPGNVQELRSVVMRQLLSACGADRYGAGR